MCRLELRGTVLNCSCSIVRDSVWGCCQGFLSSDYLEGVSVEVCAVRVGRPWAFGTLSDCMRLSIGIFRLPISLVHILGASSSYPEGGPKTG